MKRANRLMPFPEVALAAASFDEFGTNTTVKVVIQQVQVLAAQPPAPITTTP